MEIEVLAGEQLSVRPQMNADENSGK